MDTACCRRRRRRKNGGRKKLAAKIGLQVCGLQPKNGSQNDLQVVGTALV